MWPSRRRMMAVLVRGYRRRDAGLRGSILVLEGGASRRAFSHRPIKRKTYPFRFHVRLYFFSFAFYVRNESQNFTEYEWSYIPPWFTFTDIAMIYKRLRLPPKKQKYRTFGRAVELNALCPSKYRFISYVEPFHAHAYLWVQPSEIQIYSSCTWINVIYSSIYITLFHNTFLLFYSSFLITHHNLYTFTCTLQVSYISLHLFTFNMKIVVYNNVHSVK